MSKTRFAATACLCLAAGTATAKTWVVVLPESFAGPKDALMQQIGETASQVLTHPDDRLLIDNGVNLQQISAVTKPTGPKTQNPAWVRSRLAGQLAPVFNYIRAMPTTSSDGGPVAAINAPGILDEIGRNLVPSLPEKRADVLLLGSLLYYDTRNPVFSMRNGFYPLDGDLKARESEIPYGIADVGKRLQGSTVHYCGANGPTEFVTAEYEKSVHRFWSLFIAGQGGRVGTMSYDLPTCFARLQSDQASGQIAYTPSSDPRIGMIRFTLSGATPVLPPSTGLQVPQTNEPPPVRVSLPVKPGSAGFRWGSSSGTSTMGTRPVAEGSGGSGSPQHSPSASSKSEVVPFVLAN